MGWHFLKPFWCDASNNQMRMEDWSPTTDPAAMLQVIEQMREKGFRVELGDTQTDGWDWYAGFFKDDKVVGNQTGTSLMKCVCLAACAAVEGGRETK